MSFLSSFNISASGLTAQRMRLDVISENISNIDTTRTESGEPYRRKLVVFQAIDGKNFSSILKGKMRYQMPGGVKVTQIVEDQTPLKSVYNPEHPDADENGYVQMPNVDLLKETVDSMAASRAYDANISAFNAMKNMATKALDIGK